VVCRHACDAARARGGRPILPLFQPHLALAGIEGKLMLHLQFARLTRGQLLLIRRRVFESCFRRRTSDPYRVTACSCISCGPAAVGNPLQNPSPSRGGWRGGQWPGHTSCPTTCGATYSSSHTASCPLEHPLSAAALQPLYISSCCTPCFSPSPPARKRLRPWSEGSVRRACTGQGMLLHGQSPLRNGPEP
jgi:hypothetical protein